MNKKNILIIGILLFALFAVLFYAVFLKLEPDIDESKLQIKAIVLALGPAVIGPLTILYFTQKKK